MMSSDGGQYAHDATERELERLKRFGQRLTALKPRTDLTIDDLQALQDANLAAFETMTESVGVSALERMTLVLEEMRKSLEDADKPEAAAELAPRMRAAAQELDALRDRETERLLDRIETLFAQGPDQKDK
ncbi:MAG: hypothetical protein MRY74_04525 [Neomegalonema sp.]|nr:hypothetical protein [Neomegalonema sp.]